MQNILLCFLNGVCIDNFSQGFLLDSSQLMLANILTYLLNISFVACNEFGCPIWPDEGKKKFPLVFAPFLINIDFLTAEIIKRH